MNGVKGGLTVLLVLVMIGGAFEEVRAYVGEEPADAFEPVMEFETRSITGYVDISRDGRYALLWHSKAAYLADNIAGKVLGEVLRIRGLTGINDVDYGSSGKAVFALSNESVAIVEPLEKRVLWVTRVADVVSAIGVSFNLEEDRVFALDAGSVVHVLNVSDGSILKEFKSKVLLGRVVGGPGELVVATIVDAYPTKGYSNRLIAIDLGSGEVMWRTELPATAYGLSWSPDGRRIAAGAGDGVVYIIDRLEGRVVYEINLTKPVLDVVYRGERELLALLSNGTVARIDPVYGKVLGALGHKFKQGELAYGVLSPKGTMYYTVYDTVVYKAYKLFPANNLSTITILGVNNTSVEGMVFKISENGYTVFFEAGDRRSLKLYATPGVYTVSYRYEEVPHKVFFMSHQPIVDPPSGSVEIRTESQQNVTVEVRTMYSEFALLHVIGPPGYYFMVEHNGDLSLQFPISEDGEYYLFLHPGKYNVILSKVDYEPVAEPVEVVLEKGKTTTVVLRLPETPTQSPKAHKESTTHSTTEEGNAPSDQTRSTSITSSHTSTQTTAPETRIIDESTVSETRETIHIQPSSSEPLGQKEASGGGGGGSFDELWRVAVLVLLGIIALSLAVIAVKIRR